MKKWRKNGVRRHSKTLETVENKGVVERNEIRNRSFFPISFMHSNLYEMS